MCTEEVDRSFGPDPFTVFGRVLGTRVEEGSVAPMTAQRHADRRLDRQQDGIGVRVEEAGAVLDVQRVGVERESARREVCRDRPRAIEDLLERRTDLVLDARHRVVSQLAHGDVEPVPHDLAVDARVDEGISDVNVALGKELHAARARRSRCLHHGLSPRSRTPRRCPQAHREPRRAMPRRGCR